MQRDSSAESAKNLSNVIKINGTQIQDHFGEMVRSMVEETFNAILDAEADQLCGILFVKYAHRDKCKPLGSQEMVPGG